MSDQQSKKQILKSTGILGTVQVITILVGMIRIKVLAVLLGPVGVGIAGIYQTIILIISSATGLGLNFSGVRDIATAVTSGDEARIARTALTLRRWTWVTGLLGMIATLVFCKLLSRLSFGNENYAFGIAVLSVALLLSSITGGKNALLKGMRKIVVVAKANIIAAIVGLIGTVVIYYFWALKGIVPALLFTYLTGQIITWYFALKIKTPKVSLSIRESYKEGLSMAKLGFFMVITTCFNYGFMFIVRSFIMQKGGIEWVGHFVAAWTISSMYISIIFSAMGADFYPRLCGVQDDNTLATKIVNEQTEIALLLTTPIIIFMTSFIGVVIKIFYSKNFGPTAGILNWQLLGDFVKVLGYPLGYILLAKANGKLVIITELVWNILFLALIWAGWNIFGIKISGIAFLVAYIVNVSIVFIIVNRMIRFTWSSNVVYYILFFLPLLVLSFLSSTFLVIAWQKYVAGTLLTLSAVLFSIMQLKKIISFHTVLDKLKLKTIPYRFFKKT
jgi:PST family polysaccharide transporter